jgi:hypothetical protein
MLGPFDHVAEDIFHHDDRGVHHKAKVKRAHRKQIGRFP